MSSRRKTAESYCQVLGEMVASGSPSPLASFLVPCSTCAILLCPLLQHPLHARFEFLSHIYWTGLESSKGLEESVAVSKHREHHSGIGQCSQEAGWGSENSCAYVLLPHRAVHSYLGVFPGQWLWCPKAQHSSLYHVNDLEAMLLNHHLINWLPVLPRQIARGWVPRLYDLVITQSNSKELQSSAKSMWEGQGPAFNHF